MRRRLLQVLLPLLALLVVGISVPAATAIAERHTGELVADRINDASRLSVAAFAALSGGAGIEGGIERLAAELDDYAELYDTGVWLVDRDRELLHAAGAGTPPLPAGADGALDQVLAGQSPEVARTVWPWQTAGELIVAPVGRDSQVVAALVLDVPVTAVRHATLLDWGVLALALLVPLGAAVALVGPTTRWLLRPVHALESTAAEVASGDLEARAAADTGPPELRTLGRSFNTMVDAVRTTVERQQAFLGDAAHQLRNPVASLRLSVENLEAHVDRRDPEARATYADAIDDLDRMSGVIDGMLAATRFQNRPSRETPAGEALEPGRAGWLARCAEAGLEAEVVVADPGTRIVEPTGGLVACVDELVANAVRLSGGTRVLVRAGRGGAGAYRVEVVDDGRGLDAQEREAATRRFWRSPRVQNVAGTGLGLTILGQVSADAGGRLELAETPGGGLTATLVLRVV
ncbi:HAMP domain-containing sensor histidine kinase [Nocardioides zeae]|uniref:histidine kinase n=1 Tax=Nocardioides imazamoxiresistens TaxID=3231893 RepID=A0ABU3PUJ9_9ACTN|nr:HAMP domain-containing sensor histidine kinase [Nocardioides zeae]MDT9592886.1 HAMP domain-containing sensor histidine kinase [Nocardioides zeae]